MKKRVLTAVTALVLVAAMICVYCAVFAEGENAMTNSSVANYDIEDTNPAIYVAERNANSTVGIITNVTQWNDRTRESTSTTYSEGSGVVIADGGYIVTNYHVVANGDTYQVLMPSGEKVDAELVGYDSSYDLAVVKVNGDAAKELVPAAIGDISRLKVGSTVIAIGNPGGETLSSTVTSGIISNLARDVRGGNTSRTVEYIQHDASISSGNSGGGLFDINGNLIGINTLKYANSYYSSGSYEGLGFAIPVEIVYPVAEQIINFGHVRRLGIGVGITAVSGADEPTDTEAPAGLYVSTVTEGSPAEEAGIKEGDYIIRIDGERVTSTQDLTDVIDKHQEGDKVTITVARYTADEQNDKDDFTRTENNSSGFMPTAGGSYSSPYGFGWGFPFGGFGDDYEDYYDYYFGNRTTYHLEVIDFEVTLKVLD